ncbi:MAG TPA: class I SAM-dependent methyltransferase [Clostridiales bacterium]|nr:class I SAM-dependent methyltransferase [Clostridiales bacterium]
MHKDFKEIYSEHNGKVSDKWMLYIKEWDQIFLPFRDKEVNLLEIGIQNGGSLEIWAKYFEKARHIVGCDINEACHNLEFDDPRITTVIGDANSDEVDEKLKKITPEFDIIIDDGSHLSGDIVRSFSHYFKRLNVNGVYLIEDLHTSYWDQLGGGLYEPYSAITFLKRLVDLTNYEHWRINQSRKEYLLPYSQKYGVEFNESDLSMIKSVMFMNSLCLIYKNLSEETELGERMIVGLEEKITENTSKWDGTTIHDMTPVIFKDVSTLDVFSLIEQTDKLMSDAKKDKRKISSLNSRINELESEILSYENSKSWKITKPLRILAALFKGENKNS